MLFTPYLRGRTANAAPTTAQVNSSGRFYFANLTGFHHQVMIDNFLAKAWMATGNSSFLHKRSNPGQSLFNTSLRGDFILR